MAGRRHFLQVGRTVGRPGWGRHPRPYRRTASTSRMPPPVPDGGSARAALPYYNE